MGMEKGNKKENKNMGKKQLELVSNRFGIGVKKCCASCQQKEYDDQYRRICVLKGKCVRGCEVCDNWSMSDGLMKTGANRGRVVSREYQLSLMKVRGQELLAAKRGKAAEPMTLAQIQRQFEEEHGSRFALR